MLPGVLDHMHAISKTVKDTGLSPALLEMVFLRASQINGCSVCVDMHSRALRKLDEKAQRIFLVAAWREAPYYSDAERAAFALTECLCRMADKSDPVPDEVWNEVARHYSEKQLAGLVMAIAQINVWNRVNAATHQITGDFVEQFI